MTGKIDLDPSEARQRRRLFGRKAMRRREPIQWHAMVGQDEVDRVGEGASTGARQLTAMRSRTTFSGLARERRRGMARALAIVEGPMARTSSPASASARCSSSHERDVGWPHLDRHWKAAPASRSRPT